MEEEHDRESHFHHGKQEAKRREVGTEDSLFLSNAPHKVLIPFPGLQILKGFLHRLPLKHRPLGSRKDLKSQGPATTRLKPVSIPSEDRSSQPPGSGQSQMLAFISSPLGFITWEHTLYLKASLCFWFLAPVYSGPVTS